MSKTVSVRIVAETTVEIDLAEGETLEDIGDRSIDIYMNTGSNAYGEDAHMSKEDNGGYIVSVHPAS